MKYRLAIFDFDGTLADSFPFFIRVFDQLADRHGFRRIAPDEVPALRHYSARQMMRLPARLDLPEDSLPEWVRTVRAEMRVAPVDWAMLSERGSDWMTYWDRTVRGKGAAAAAR